MTDPESTGRRGAAGEHRPAAAPAWRARRRRADAAGELGAGAAGPRRAGHGDRAGPPGADQPAVDGRDARRRSRRAAWSSARPDPDDGRRVVLSITDAGLQVLRDRRDARTEQLARALSAGSRRAELEQLHGRRAAARAAGAEHLMTGRERVDGHGGDRTTATSGSRCRTRRRPCSCRRSTARS